MAQLYKKVQAKIKRLEVQEPNPYVDRKNKFQREYLIRLDKVVKEYPAYKAGLPNDYDQQLSLLNGISKDIRTMLSEIKETTRRFERKVDIGDLDIQKLKTVERNLQHFTSIEDLDVTSKQMLADHVTMYNQQQLLFWIKLGVIAFLMVDSFHEKEYARIGLLCGMTLVFGILYLIYQRYTSRG